jgi:hypothetical protein
MGVKATRLDGWTDYTPEVKGNTGADAVRCQIRPLSPALHALLAQTGRQTAELQRDILMTCSRQLQNYTGVKGEDIDEPWRLLTDDAGKEGATYVLAVVNAIAGMTYGAIRLGESDAPSASS